MATYLLQVVLVVIVASVAVCQQSEPIHCCVDSKFTVVERIVAGSVLVNGTGAGAVMITQVSASDYDGKLIAAEVVSTDTAGVTTEYKIIESFDLGFGWIIQNGDCTEFEFEGNMPDNCVPYDRDIEYLGPLRYMGFVPAQSWRMVLWPELGDRGISEFIVAEDGCIPIASSFHGESNLNEPATDVFNAGLFFNFTRGIENYDEWFAIPSNCPQYTKNENFQSRRKMLPLIYPPFFQIGGHKHIVDFMQI